jgi:hypothetical protein
MDVAATVDALLRGAPVRSEHRRRLADGSIELSSSEESRRDPSAAPRRGSSGTPANGRSSSRSNVDTSDRHLEELFSDADAPPEPVPLRRQRSQRDLDEPLVSAADARPSIPTVAAFNKGRGTDEKPLRVFPFGVSRNRLDQAIYQHKVPAVIVKNERDADVVLTLKSAYRQKAQPVRDAESRGVPVYVLRSNTNTQIDNVLSSIFPQAIAQREEDDDAGADEPAPSRRDRRVNDVVIAMSEAEEAITAVMQGATVTALRPQSPRIRRMQHEMAERYNLSSRSRGRDPFRHVEIYRRGMQ